MPQLTDQQFAQYLDTIAALAGSMEKFKTASGTPSAQLGHGPGGPFSTPGLNRQVFNAGVVPVFGLMSRLPVRSSIDINPLHPILTGVTEVTGSHPAGQCDPCKIPGNLKRCVTKSTFGRFCLSTKTFDVSGDLGAVNNRGEFRDFQLIGNPFDASVNSVVPTLPAATTNPLNSEVAKQMYEFKVGWAREYSRWLYTGNPANNSGSYKEPRGLDILVNTGYQDAETGAFCGAADALVMNFGSQNITTGGAAVATDLVSRLTGIVRRQRHTAGATGMNPVRWAFVMSEMLFYEITAVWPCNYAVNRCVSAQTGAVVNLDAEAMRRMVEDMRNGMYLLVDGVRYDVITDDAIIQTNALGVFTSPIYFLPLSVVGGTPTLYIEYFDYENGDAREVRNVFGAPGKYITTDAGRFIWAKRENGFCVSMDAVERSRIILETPFLSARLTNVSYTPFVQTKSGYATGGPSFYDGGSTSIPAPSFYAPTVYSN